jgi:hypothetical protein
LDLIILENMNFLRFFLSLIIVCECSSENKNIDWLFLLCDQTETIVELPYNCQDLPVFEMNTCEMFRNDLQIFSKIEDHFNFVDSPNGQIVIYCFNRNVYLASCSTIKEILIPEKIDQCTMDCRSE